ncbi:Y-family DNA polymerase [Alteromonas sp. CYL-A6]|uniref:Y-family DNA polymerase n=1 Tax=Alteromonas nitratireducens TaxID=3390813 RepID=UPI0034B4F95E
MQHWLYLHFPSLSLDLRLLGDTASDMPTAIYAPSQNQVCQINQAARKHGICVGMGMAQAAALCSDLQVHTYDAQAQKRYLLSLADRVYQVASDILVVEEQALAVRLDNLRFLYGNDQVAFNAIVHEISPRVSDIQYAGGWSVECARVLALAHSNMLQSDTVAIRQALDACSLQFTELDTKTISAFHRIGVRTIKQLMALPVSELGKRFNNTTLRYIHALRSTGFTQLTPFQPQDTFSQRVEVTFDIELAAHCRPYLCRLLNNLEVFLRVRNQGSNEIRITLSYRDAPSDSRTFSSSALLTQAGSWLRLVDVWLETCQLPAPVTQLQLDCEVLEPHQGNSGDFFTDKTSYFARAQLLSRLRTRFGDEALWQPSRQHDHRFGVLSDAPRPASHDAVKDDSPAFILATPDVLGAESRVIFGPHRIQTGWWDNAGVKRDYFIVRTCQGEHWQVFREDAGPWYRHGVYS